MKLAAKMAIAAATVAALAMPALAGQWVYHGGPKSMTWYEPDGYYGNYAYESRGPYYGGPQYVVPDDD
jgi:hypothetical protein